jgi:hypothetical protein
LVLGGGRHALEVRQLGSALTHISHERIKEGGLWLACRERRRLAGSASSKPRTRMKNNGVLSLKDRKMHGCSLGLDQPGRRRSVQNRVASGLDDGGTSLSCSAHLVHCRANACKGQRLAGCRTPRSGAFRFTGLRVSGLTRWIGSIRGFDP